MNKDDVLVLYSAGTGGEFLTGLISRTVDDINTLTPTEVGPNHWNLACKRTYADVYNANPEKFPDGIDSGYTGEKDKPINIYKDHLIDVDILADYWYNDMTVIALGLPSHYQYWAEITWKKLHTVNITGNKKTFIKNHALALEETYNMLHEYKQRFTNFNVIDIGRQNFLSTISPQLCSIAQFSNINKQKFDVEHMKWIDKNNGIK